MSVDLEEFEPGRWRIKREPRKRLRSDLPMPSVISDIMEPTEQVDGKFYSSKRAFRAVGRALGLTEVGTETQNLVDFVLDCRYEAVLESAAG